MAAKTLMDRTTAGVRVRVGWSAETDEVVLHVQVGEDGEQGTQTVVVPRDKALEAFHHPFLFAREVTV